MKTLCGIDCNTCGYKENCSGCAATKGSPFGGTCIIANCCGEQGCETCADKCRLRRQIIHEVNALGIADMEPLTEIFALIGQLVNLEHTLPSGQTIRFWQDNHLYLGAQRRKLGTDRYYGITADERFLLVCEYGENGTDAEIVVYKKR